MYGEYGEGTNGIHLSQRLVHNAGEGQTARYENEYLGYKICEIHAYKRIL